MTIYAFLIYQFVVRPALNALPRIGELHPVVVRALKKCNAEELTEQKKRSFFFVFLLFTILFSGNYAYQFGNNVVPEKYAVARERDFIAIDIKIARARKSIKFFAEKRKQIDAEFLRIFVQPYAALLH